MLLTILLKSYLRIKKNIILSYVTNILNKGVSCVCAYPSRGDKMDRIS